jgi:hypothetical protein
MKYLILILCCLLLTSCGFYHWPKVYRYNTIPYDIEVPLHKNMKQNKYNPNNPYYEKDTTENRLEN